jgi:hypothetical protein
LCWGGAGFSNDSSSGVVTSCAVAGGGAFNGVEV